VLLLLLLLSIGSALLLDAAAPDAAASKVVVVGSNEPPREHADFLGDAEGLAEGGRGLEMGGCKGGEGGYF
jgi:hypothetical protein